MEETILSFYLPELGDDVVGNVTVRVETETDVISAQHSFNCHDARQAKLLYMLPAKAYAEDATIITVGLSNFDGQSNIVSSVNAR